MISTFLNGQTPTQLRGLMWLALSDLGQVGSGTITDDSGGGGTATWSYGGTVACRIDPILPSSRITGGAIDERSTHVVHVPTGTTVLPQNRFLIAGRGTFEVTATTEQTAELSSSFEVIQLQ
jgi:hypothetical protein